LATAFTIFLASGSIAAPVTVDDSASVALEPTVAMRWKSAAPTRSAADDVMVGRLTVHVRLNVTPWLRRSGRIYLVLPAQPPGPLRMSWTTQGRLIPGQMQSGNRALVYAGSFLSPYLEDTVNFQFTVVGALLTRTVPVTYHFEMDGA
jgi:hypothetical protein